MKTSKTTATSIVLTAEAARIAGVSAMTIRYWEQTGRLRAEKTTNGTRLFKRCDVIRLAEARARDHARPTSDAAMSPAS
jgi:DNA-binding transcriptional MerR regulator